MHGLGLFRRGEFTEGFGKEVFWKTRKKFIRVERGVALLCTKGHTLPVLEFRYAPPATPRTFRSKLSAAANFLLYTATS